MAGPSPEQHDSSVARHDRPRSRYDGTVNPHRPSESPPSGRDLRGRHLPGEDLARADLRLANLISANLSGARLVGATLTRAKIHDGRLRFADLDSADLSGVHGRDVDMEGASLRGANLSQADLRGAILLEADLSGADLSGANFTGADLRGANLTDARLDRAVFNRADLAGAQLSLRSADGLHARGARLGGSSGDLVAALQAAGALSRPPLGVGLWTALFVRWTFNVASRIWQILRPRLAPIVAIMDPLYRLAQSKIPRLGKSLRNLPARILEQTRSVAARIVRGLRQSGSLAGRVRAEAQERLRQAASERQERARRREEHLQAQRQAKAARVQEQMPGGPGADLTGRDFRGARLALVLWSDAKLSGANLKASLLDKADLRSADLTETNLVGARLRAADLRGARLTRADCEGARLRDALMRNAKADAASLIDADLRGADLRGADLTGARLIGADLRGAQLSGATLAHADLTGARLPDVDLIDVNLDSACFNQADVAGVQWAPSSAVGTTMSGALGLSAREREQLRQLGAAVDDIHLDRLLGRLDARPVQFGLGMFALGMVTLLGARFLGSEVINPAQIEVNAQALRSSDPLAASEKYVELAGLSRRVEDRVGYLVEAALLSASAGDTRAAETYLEEALDAAEPTPALASETRLRLANFFYDNLRWTEALEAVEPLVSEVDQPTEQRARAIVVYDKTRDALGLTDSSLRDQAFSSLGDLPETQADLHIALAELYTNDGDTSRALQEIDAADGLDIAPDLAIRVLEARARLLDRTGDIKGAIGIWEQVMEASGEGSISAQAAPLAIADLHLRAGRPQEAEAYLAQILGPDTDERIRGRGLLISARVSETRGDIGQALVAYRSVLAIAELDAETLDEARIAMAGLVLSEQDSEAAQSILRELSPDAVSEVMAQAKLGDARRLLDEGSAAEAHPIFEELAAREALPRNVSRAARAGLGEALAQMGELRDALDIWRELLAEPGSRQDRLQLELLVANGLLQGGRRKEASTAFRSLSDSDNAEARVQGLLGLAEVARASSEQERAKSFYRQVADLDIDPVWTVRALAELTDMAAELGDTPAVVTLTRELLGALPPGHVAAPEYRLNLIAALLQTGALDEARGLCQLALDASPNALARQAALVACSEVEERAGRYETAFDGYAAVLDMTAPQDVLTDAALGLGRCAFGLNEPSLLIEPAKRTLALTESPALRLPLLTLLIRAHDALGQATELASATAERNAIAEAIPEIAWASYIEAAGQARSAGDPDQAAALLLRALDLPISPEQRSIVTIELGMALIDAGDLVGARERLSQVHTTADNRSSEQFYSAMGLAEVERRLGEPRLALEWLEGLTPPDDEEEHAWMVARATALVDAGDERAQDVWAELAEKTSATSDARYTALKGQADALLSEDKAEEALKLFIEARAIASEDWQSGWAGIGQAAAQAELGELDASITLLDELLNHADPEVRMEAMLRRSSLAADSEDWQGALRALNPRAAIDLGPAWDASVTQARTRALMGAGDGDGARAAWRALAARWPTEEEAVLPAWLALAQIAMDIGDTADAHHWARKAFKEAQDPGYARQARDLVQALGQ